MIIIGTSYYEILEIKSSFVKQYRYRKNKVIIINMTW